jgi:hypothetical protein
LYKKLERENGRERERREEGEKERRTYQKKDICARIYIDGRTQENRKKPSVTYRKKPTDDISCIHTYWNNPQH